MAGDRSGSERVIEATVVGEAIVDVIRSGDEGAGDAGAGSVSRRPGGSPLNVAVGLSRLGVPTRLIARLGDDADGELIREHLRASRVDEGGLERAPRTSTAVATIASDGSASYDFDIDWDLARDAGGGNATGEPSRAAGRLIHFGSIAATLEPGASRVEALIRNRPAGMLASYDPNIRPQLIERPEEARRRVVALMALADIVKLSDEDAEWIHPGASAEDALELILDGGARVAAVTRGADGAILRTPGARAEVPTLASTVADTVGAGDSFMAGLLLVSLERGLPAEDDGAALRAMAEFAARCSAITVSRPGADLPWREELQA